MSVRKTCTKCGQTKALEEFHRDKRAKDGRRPDCKDCKRAANSKRREDPTYREMEQQKNADRQRAKMRDPGCREKERARQRTSGYRASANAAHARRREREANQPNDGSGMSDYLFRMEDDDAWFCVLCGGPFGVGDAIEAEHRDPVCARHTGDAPKAGRTVANMTPVHRSCNRSRGDVPLAEWHARLGLPDGVV